MDESSVASADARSLRERLGDWVESAPVRRFIVLCIVVNAITLGMETSPRLMQHYGFWLHLIDHFVLWVFVVELSIKIFAFGWAFFRNGWYIFDFIIVFIALLPDSGPLSVMRTLRVFRVLRSVSVIPGLRHIVMAMFRAIPNMGYTIILMLMIYYIFAVMATQLYGEDFPEWFGGLGSSLYTLFQLMTLESWSMGVVRPMMEQHPSAWMFFVPFILLTTFAVLNLFVAIIVEAMQKVSIEEHPEQNSLTYQSLQRIQQDMQQDRAAMQAELAALRQLIQQQQQDKS